MKAGVQEVINPWVAKSVAILLGVSYAIGGVAPVSGVFSAEVAAATQFRDDSTIRDYSREPIEYLVKTGGIKGYAEDNTFRPQGTLTRIEALALLMNSVDPSGTARDKYVQMLKNSRDVAGDPSYYESTKAELADDIAEVWGGKAQDILIISRSIRTGIFDIESEKYNGKSGWLAPITRAEFALMATAVIEKIGGEKLEITDNIEAVIGDYTKSYTDPSQAKSTHYNTVKGCAELNSILKLYSAGIVNGSTSQGVEHCYLPQTTLTREQAATIVYKAVNKDKRTKLTVPAREVKPERANTTIDLSQEDRLTAKAGDTVVYQGKSYTVGEIAGVPYVKGLALDLGRRLTKAPYDYIVKNGTTSDGTLEGSRLGDSYIIAPNGTGLWGDQWKTLMRYYEDIQNAKGAGTDWQRIKVGDDGWLELEYLGDSWGYIVPDWM